MLTKAEIGTFCTSMMRQEKAKPSEAKTLYSTILADISESGYRITRRVKDEVWAKLEEMEAGR